VHVFVQSLARRRRLNRSQLQACSDRNIVTGPDPSLTHLFKSLRLQHPAFQDVGPRSEDVAKLLGAMATVVDVLNPLRNKASVAHPNQDLLAEPEALLVIKLGQERSSTTLTRSFMPRREREICVQNLHAGSCTNLATAPAGN
jgi:hypothetical protein